MCMIQINRLEGSIADGHRPYRVIIDGESRGEIAEGDVARFEVAPGIHSVRLVIDFHRSVSLKVCVEQSGCQLLCRSNSKRLLGLLSMFEPTNWIETVVHERSDAVIASPRRMTGVSRRSPASREFWGFLAKLEMRRPRQQGLRA